VNLEEENQGQQKRTNYTTFDSTALQSPKLSYGKIERSCLG